MKKLYFLTALLFFGMTSMVSAQYTATNSGTWSNSVTWAPGSIPSTVCNNCTITISAGIIVQLDAHIELAGNTVFTLQDGAEIVIGASTGTSITSGYNIVMDTLPGNSTIVLSTPTSAIIASAASTFDGVFIGPFPSSLYQKIIGNPPTLFLGGEASGTAPAAYGTELTGSHVLFSGGTLPLVLASFTARLENNQSLVTWTTSEESNLRDFEVLRSGDGANWVTIGSVPAKGNSSIPTNYSYTDASPLPGNNYYRIESIDEDLHAALSNVALVQSSLIRGLRIVNPARGFVQVILGSDIDPKVTLRLFNESGQLMQEKPVSNGANSTVMFPVSTYPSGIYTLSVQSSKGSNSFRVLITN